MTTIHLPALDDRTFDDLVREALVRLPAVAPEWTNHNPSDPGITLVELFAYFTEILLYRMGRVPPASKLQFLRLLTGDSAAQVASPARAGNDDIALALNDAARELSQVDCAVTAGDFERLARSAASLHLHGATPVRVLCVAGARLDGTGPNNSRRASKADVSVVIVPAQRLADEGLAALCAVVRRELLPRCLLGTRLHVSGPVYLQVGIGVALVPKPGRERENLRRTVAQALRRRFSNWTRTDDHAGAQPTGRPLYLAEIIATIDEVDGVDYVTNLTVLQLGSGTEELASPSNGVGIQIGKRSTLGRDSRLGTAGQPDGDRLLRADAGRLLGIRLQPWELLELVLMEDAFVIANNRPRMPGQTDGAHDG